MDHFEIRINQRVGRTYIHILLKLFDLAFEGLDEGDEGDSVRGAGGVHRVLFQFQARLQKGSNNKQDRLTFK